MKAVLPPRWTPGNPVDLVGIRPAGKDNPGDICLQLLLEDKNVDAIISLVPPMLLPSQAMALNNPTKLKAMQRENEKIQAKLYRQLKEYDKPLVYVRRITISLPKELQEKASKPKVTIPEYNHPRRAARVLRYLAGYRDYLKSA
jgi:acyl-CoA synthetase (NDP forming)